MDYELASWKAFWEALPGVHLQGCYFHWSQCIWRKMQEVGLQAPYLSDNDLARFVRRIFVLPFLPATCIPGAFRRLRRRANSPKVRELMRYQRDTWMRHRLWSPSNWSVFRRDVRTNNAVEGWHNRLKEVCGHGKVSLYKFIHILQLEAIKVRTDLRDLRDGRLSQRRREPYVRMGKQIRRYWSRFSNGRISANQLLRMCASVYRPRVQPLQSQYIIQGCALKFLLLRKSNKLCI